MRARGRAPLSRNGRRGGKARAALDGNGPGRRFDVQSQLCRMFGIEAPICAFSHCRDVVVEASKAGGLGVLGASGFTKEQLEIELDWIDAHIGGRPYGVDVLMPNKYVKVKGFTEADL